MSLMMIIIIKRGTGFIIMEGAGDRGGERALPRILLLQELRLESEIGVETYSKIHSPSNWDGHQEMFPVPWGRNNTELTFTLGNWNGGNINNKYKSSYTDNVLFYYPIIFQKPQGKQGNGAADHLCGTEVYSLFMWIDPLCLPTPLWARNYYSHLIDKKKKSEAEEGSWIQYFIKSQASGLWGVDGIWERIYLEL